MERSPPRHPSAQRVDRALRARGLLDRVHELPASTRTAPEAAQAVGCDVRQIVKSLLFRTAGSGTPVLVLASGGHRVDEQWMQREVGEPLARADPEYVRSVTGFAIGGVPPVGHDSEIPTFVDYDLLEFHEIWAAAGHPNAVFRLTSRELLELTGGRAVPVTPPATPPAAERAWVTFDCYGTLIDWRTGLLEALRRTTASWTEAERARLFPAYLAAEQRLEGGPYRTYRELVVDALREAAATCGRSISESEAGEVPESIPEWPAFSDTRAALEALRAHGFRIAVLSNIDRDLLDRTLRAHDLAVDLSVTASDVRSYKPFPAHWVRFLKQTHVVPNEVWHVAGAYPYDIPVAARLGFRTAYIARYSGETLGPGTDEVLPDLSSFVARRARAE